MAAQLCALLVAGLFNAPMAASATGVRPQIPRVSHLRVLPDLQLNNPITPTAAAKPAHLKTYTSTVQSLGTTYSYTMVGTNPVAPSVVSNRSTITAALVPLIIQFANGDTFSPTAADSCDPGATPLTRTEMSPLFRNHAWTWGGTSIGTGQYLGAFERAEFWQYVKPTGSNPGYRLHLRLSTLPAITVSVPLADSAEATGFACGSGKLGILDPIWSASYLLSTLIPKVQSFGINPRIFPIFLTHNVVLGNSTSCCILGIHSAISTALGVQTFAFGDYENSGAFGASESDISDLAHEVAEWANDPFGQNQTPPWGHIGQQSGCQNTLEVGDPLSGSLLSVPFSGFVYHPQELAFFSWFYRQSPSLGANGWYSNNGTLTTTQGNCA
jgi:hypothetical protein